MAGPFAGFPREATDFFKGLEAHKTREWFQARKDVYERACQEPMKDLVAELGPQCEYARFKGSPPAPLLCTDQSTDRPTPPS